MLLKLYFFVLLECCGAVVRNSSYTLEQVVILSRHNLRSPLDQNMDEVTPKTWPKWNQKPGHLTAKGYKLEGYMGEFFSQWLAEQKLLPSGCPNEEVIYVYANTKQRTRASAQAFVKKAFPNCSVVVHSLNTEESDPVFKPAMHNRTAEFKETMVRRMKERLSTLRLNHSLVDLETILDFQQSKMCKETQVCSLRGITTPVFIDWVPKLPGPLKIGTSTVDTFVMQYYEGFPSKDVAWGEIKDSKQWYDLLEIQDGYHNIIFNTTELAKDIAKPLLHYIRDTFRNETPKITLLMGHDANMLTVMNSLKFKAYRLPNQFELTPVGSKIVFQKWYDRTKHQYLLRAEYVYQSTNQIRNAKELSLENPPMSHLMELHDCKIDNNGFCSWNDFIKLLDDVVLSFK